MGVPAATTDLSGFGAYVVNHIPDHDQQGILVLKRRERGFDDTCNALVDYLMAFARLNRRQRIEMRNAVEQLGERFDWSVLIRHYDEAHNLALERVGARRTGSVDVRMV
jgi:glycogen(starch) synthase